MSVAPPTLPGRVVVELHIGADVRLASVSAARLSRIFGSKIKGIFFEDAELLELAELALAVEINVMSRHLRTLDAKALPSEMRRSLASARRVFDDLARSLQCDVELEVARRSGGEPALQVHGDDILLISEAFEAGFDPASPQRAAAAKAMAIAFPAARTPSWEGPVMALLGSESSLRRSRGLLERIAAAERAQLDVVVSEEPLSALLRLFARAESLGAGRSRLPRMIVSEAGLLDAPNSRPLRSLMRKAGCPLLFLNPQPSELAEGELSA